MIHWLTRLYFGEFEETAEKHIDWKRPHILTEKIDGYIEYYTKDTNKYNRSLISPFINNGKIVLASKNGPTKLSVYIEESYFVKNPDKQFMSFFEDWLSRGFTPMFEWVSPESQVVLKYDEPQLHLIAIRNIVEGSI
jgi:RNA ligase